MLSFDHLEEIRKHELSLILPHIPSGERIIEIGAGLGWQAKALKDLGFDITAIDIQDNRNKDKHVSDILEYDGRTIPFPDSSFGGVYSSNTLEHIPNLHEFLIETRRILTTGGIAIHILPSAVWRIFTNLSHYLFILQAMFNMLFPHVPGGNQQSTYRVLHDALSKMPLSSMLRRSAFPLRHGETGNFLTETYYFSRFRWNKIFRESGWVIERHLFNRLFYTGYGVLDSHLSIQARNILSYILGSSCHIYVLRKAGN